MIITEVSQVGQTRSQTRWLLSPKSMLFHLWYTTFGGRMVVLVVEGEKVVESTHCSSGLRFPLHSLLRKAHCDSELLNIRIPCSVPGAHALGFAGTVHIYGGDSLSITQRPGLEA